MNKQIEEIAWDLCDIPKHPSIKSCEQCGNKHCLAMYYAKRACNNGYRKSTDVAREISQDIIEPLWNTYKNSTCQETVLLVALICETINNLLKKKYESEGADDENLSCLP